MIGFLTDTVLTITGFLLILMAIVILKQQTTHRLNAILLSAFLLSKAFLITRWFLFRMGISSYEKLPYGYVMSASVFFLLAPLLYFYIKSLCYSDFKFKSRDILHLLPLLIFLIISFFAVQFDLTENTNDLSDIQIKLTANFWKFFWAMNLFQIISYIIAMLLTVRFYQRKLKNLFSSVEKVNLNWFITLLTLIFLHWIFVSFRSILSLLEINTGSFIEILDLFSISIFLGFTTYLVVKGLTQLKVFTGIAEKPKYANSKLSKKSISNYSEQLVKLMKTDKPYLTPSITIEDLSKQLEISPWNLSQVINFTFNKNFFNFINHYRISEAKMLFKDPSNSNKTILEMIYEVGFNSKSTFNYVFKKETGMTPTEFRKTKTH